MTSHRLIERNRIVKPGRDKVQLWLQCPQPGCLAVHVTVGPARSAEHLIESLTEAHLAQMSGPSMHTIEFRADGWTIMHPLSCRPNLFDCPVNRVAEHDLADPLDVLGRFECQLNDLGDRLLIGDRIGDTP